MHEHPTTCCEHPDYRDDPDRPGGEPCVCGGIRHWHAPPPHGCDDCECSEFTPAPKDT